MADHRICSIEGCGKRHKARGFCSVHYYRLQTHGSPLAGGAPAGALLQWLHAHAGHEGDECLEWPYNQHSSYGYGHVRVQGKQMGAHIYMCELANGPKPDWAEVAAHSCGNGYCLNPHHLRWATEKQNQWDRLRHGTHNRGARHGAAKITESQARRARELFKRLTAKEVSALTGVSVGSVYNITSGHTWGYLWEDQDQST